MDHIRQDNHVTFLAGGDLVCLPIDVFDEKETLLRRLLSRESKPIRSTTHAERVARLMWDAYKRAESTKRPLEYMPWMTPRRISAFQYKLRNTLLRWGLI